MLYASSTDNSPYRQPVAASVNWFTYAELEAASVPPLGPRDQRWDELQEALRQAPRGDEADVRGSRDAGSARAGPAETCGVVKYERAARREHAHAAVQAQEPGDGILVGPTDGADPARANPAGHCGRADPRPGRIRGIGCCPRAAARGR
jgi:hypothetical protein